jgi:hypothetical protein
MISKARALSELRPGERFSWVGDDYAGLSWEDTTPKPTEAEIDAKLSEIVANEPWRELRSERNGRLAASDWSQVADAPVDKAAWATYRQALRDLPANTTDPLNPVWPELP